jgi:hypothetical protein
MVREVGEVLEVLEVLEEASTPGTEAPSTLGHQHWQALRHNPAP